MDKLFYTISEVSEILGESVSLVRFWSNSFPRHIRPHRNAKGNRQFTSDDIDTLKRIHFLVKEKGMTLEGASRQLSENGASVDRSVKALDRLKTIRAQLVEIKSSL